MDNGSNIWVPNIHMENTYEVLDSWLQLCQVLATENICKVNKQVEDISLCLSAFQIYICV